MASLIALCASHINGTKRLSDFQRMLQSMINQHFQVPLFVSISAATDELKDEVLNIAKDNPNFTFFIQDNKLSQFEHYAFLAQALSYDPQTTWCIFTDDDDISNVNRTQVFMKHINKVTCDVGVVRDSAVWTKYTSPFHNKDDNDNYNDVIVVDLFKPTSEYVVNACRLCILQAFCSRASLPHSTIVTMAGCDMVFAAWIQGFKTRTFYNKTWLYEYTIRPGANRSIASKENLKSLDCSVLEDIQTVKKYVR